MTTTIDGDLADTYRQLRRITNEITDLQAIAEDIKARLRAAVPAGSKVEVDGQPAFSVTPNRRFNATTAEHVLPAELLELCKVSRVDAKAAKEVLPPALYAQCMVEVGEPVVRLA